MRQHEALEREAAEDMKKRAMTQMPLGAIPRGLLKEITLVLKAYAVGVFGVDGPVQNEKIRYCGSGTFVTTGGNFYILTAAHVWEALRGSARVGLALTEYESRFVIDTSFIIPTLVSKPRSAEWGPDLAFLQIPLADVPRIRAHKTFYDLSHPMRRPLGPFPGPDVGLWAFVGAPAEQSDIQPAYFELRAGVHFSGVDHIHNRAGFDYLDIGLDCTSPGLPRSFGGVSGGGLWHLLLERKLAGGKRTWRYTNTLQGVAFYESSVRANRKVIRCHWRRSIYEKGIASLVLPNHHMRVTKCAVAMGDKGRRRAGARRA